MVACAILALCVAGAGMACAAGVPVPPPPEGNELIPLDSVVSFAARGRTHAEVAKHLGQPNYRLSPDLWVYWECESNVRADAVRGFNAMIVRFTNGRVSGIRLAPRPDLEALIAQLEATKRAAAERKSPVSVAAEAPSNAGMRSAH
ncbi:MAG: hypothetical protein HY736_26745 [Verrucomicrobia bacterium]|nr:hypothetical protein [Verrucomicrobiota bacterium]